MSTKLDLEFDTSQQRTAEGSQAQGQGLLEVPGLFVKSIDQDKRQIRVLASSSALDRHGERILPEAFAGSIATFMQNPICLTAHAHQLDSGEPPVIGRVVKLWIDRQGLWGIIEFAETELAEQYWQLYSRGFMKAVSVGFIAKKGEWSSEEGVRLYVHTEVELLEISCVPVPSNPESLVKNTGGAKSWLETKKAEREDKNMRADGWPIFEEDGGEFARLLLTGDFADGSELSDSDEGEGMDFAKLVKAGARLDQPVADLPCGCDWIADALREDAGVVSFRRGAGSTRSPILSEFENEFYEV